MDILFGHTYTKICHETERATTDLKPRTESSRPGASTGAGHNVISFVFGELFLKIDEHALKICAPHSWVRLVKISNTDVSGLSEVSHSRGKLIL